MRHALSVVLCLLLGVSSALPAAKPEKMQELLEWSELPQLPPAEGQETQIGVAGPFAGVHNDALIVAGGANFPASVPWKKLPDGSSPAKVYHDDIFVLVKAGEQNDWVSTNVKLPRPLAYGVSISTADGIICIGGTDGKQCYADVFVIKWDPDSKRVSVDTTIVPAMPAPLAFMSGAMADGVVYVAGGQETLKDAAATKHFWALNLSAPKPDGEEEDEAKWEELDPWPGPARVLPVVAAQSDGLDNCIYVFSGRDIMPSKIDHVLTDAYRYNPKKAASESKGWKKLADCGKFTKDSDPISVMAGTGIKSGANHIVFFGGARGDIHIELAKLGMDIAAETDAARAAALVQKKNLILDSHPGFSREIIAYHTITDTWVKMGDLPRTSQVTTTAVEWGKWIVIPSGEIRPGVRTPQIWKATPTKPEGFRALDYSVISVYLLVLVAMGFYFSTREKTTDDFFKAGGRVPWWAAGLSIFGTQLSAITFMAIPAKTFGTDWRYFMGNMAIVMVAPFIILIFLPFYRRLNVTTAYEYLEKRFNVVARLIGSVMFMLLQFGRIGIVLLLPSIALSVVTGIPVTTCIILMGALSVTYTVLGGIEAVIWTDVLQVIVLVGGALLSAVMILFSIDGGIAGVIEIANASEKLHTFDFAFDYTTPTFWVVVFGGIAANLISYGSDQAVIQRYLTTKDEKSAARGIWLNAILCIPASILFFAIGTLLFVYFKASPHLLNATVQEADAIFPWYIVTQLPAGVAGLLIAAVFAASMSSLDSSMNSVATAFTTDFYRRFKPAARDHTCLTVARWVTVLVGVAGTLFALMMSTWEIKSLWDELSKMIGLFAGGLAGLFLLGIFSRRANGVGAVIGLVLSGAVQYAVKQRTDIHLLLYTFTGVASCIIIGYVASLILPMEAKSVEGLTIGTLRARPRAGES